MPPESQPAQVIYGNTNVQNLSIFNMVSICTGVEHENMRVTAEQSLLNIHHMMEHLLRPHTQ